MNDVNLLPLSHVPTKQAGEVFPKTSVQGNTHTNQSNGFSQNFLNLLSGAPRVRSNESAIEPCSEN